MFNTLPINSSLMFDDILNKAWPVHLRESESHYGIRCGPVWAEDKEGNYELTLEVPGIGKENAKFTIKDSTLRFEGEHGDYKYDQKYSTPEGTDASKCKAVLKNGIAKVTLPKIESQKMRQIDID
jgi:HSP20 family molecular chaperone IbpA|tara:strand:+ start:1287 stop:1661 length:375 start_codon:yes stop_codon:yes gene_type:complete